MQLFRWLKQLPLALQITVVVCTSLLVLAGLGSQLLLGNLLHLLQAFPLIICIPIYTQQHKDAKSDSQEKQNG